MSDVDPVQFGALTAQVSALEREVGEMKGDVKREVAELRSDVKELLELANKSRGGLWAGMSITATLGGIVGFFVDHLTRR